MKIRLIIAQWKQAYPGELMPNVVDAWDEYAYDENWDGYEESLAKHKAMVGTEYEDVKELVLLVPDETVLDLFKDPAPVVLPIVIEEEKEEPHLVCPHCGGTEEIYSKYRDGGSTLYHTPCGTDRTWRNPHFNQTPTGTRR